MAEQEFSLKSYERPWLVTGGAGYVGGHVIQELINAGIPVVSVDLDENSALEKFSNEIMFQRCDIRNKYLLKSVFNDFNFEGVIHLAALKSVEDSESNQADYYETNVIGTKNILELMVEYNIHKMIYSSSAAVYEAKSGSKLVSEESPLNPVSFYGKTKLDAEKLIEQYYKSNEISSVIFRYFNVAGSADYKLKDKSIQNLIPITINRIRKGESPEIFGDDYETVDGTGIRDFVDVRDIAKAHVNAIDYLEKKTNYLVLNIGTGIGYSVKQVIDLVQEILETNFEPKIKARRAGDISAITADCTKARYLIGFESKYNIREMIETSI